MAALPSQQEQLTIAQLKNYLHQKDTLPTKKFKFPKRSFGKTKIVYRSFPVAWFNHWSWLHYDASHDKIFCHVCVTAFKQNLIASSVLELAFISRGFTNWKDATASKIGFPSHDRSEAVKGLLTLPANTRDVGEHLSAEHEEEKASNKNNLLKILSNLRFFKSKASPREDTRMYENDSNFIQLCRLRGEDDPRLMAWLKKKTDIYTSAVMHNNILQIMGLTI